MGLGGDGGSGTAGQVPRGACVCVCVSLCLCVVTTAYPFRIPMKLNQHSSFVFGLALSVLQRPIKC